MPFQNPVYACTVALTGTAQNLLALVQAKGGRYANVQSSCRSYQMQLDPASASGALIGDENVAASPQNCGLNLATGDGFLDRASVPGMAPIGSLFGVAAGSAATLNLMIFPE